MQTNFCLQALEEGVRTSGRGFNQRRPISITFGPAFGQVEVCLADTTVVTAEVSAELIIPPPDRPNEGTFVINARYSQATKFRDTMSDQASRQSAIQLAYIIERLIRGSRVIDPQSLCILAGKRVWALRLSILAIVDGGNVVDAAGIAAMGALSHFRRQDVTVKGRDITIHSKDDSGGPLPLLHQPIIISFAVVNSKSNTILLVDPDETEERCSTSILSVAADISGDICQIYKGGGTTLSPTMLNHCLELVQPHVNSIAEQLTKALEMENSAKRAPMKFTALESLE